MTGVMNQLVSGVIYQLVGGPRLGEEVDNVPSGYTVNLLTRRHRMDNSEAVVLAIWEG